MTESDETMRLKRVAYCQRRRQRAWKHDKRTRQDILAEVVVVAISVGVTFWLTHPKEWLRELGYPAVAGVIALIVSELFLRPVRHYVWSIPENDYLEQSDEIDKLRETIQTLNARLTPKLGIHAVKVQITPTTDASEHRAYVQLVPVSLTQAQVQGCMARLLKVEIWSEEENAWQPTSLNEPLLLNWSMRGDVPVTVRPGVDQRLNLCWANNRGRVVADVHDLPLRGAHVLNLEDRFRFSVYISAQDGTYTTADVEVAFHGDWNHPTVSLVPNPSNTD